MEPIRHHLQCGWKIKEKLRIANHCLRSRLFSSGVFRMIAALISLILSIIRLWRIRIYPGKRYWFACRFFWRMGAPSEASSTDHRRLGNDQRSSRLGWKNQCHARPRASRRLPDGAKQGEIQKDPDFAPPCERVCENFGKPRLKNDI